MGLFDRLSTLIKSNLNDLISSAEHPEKILNQVIVDMRDQLATARQEVAVAIADEKRLKEQADAEFRHAQDWEQRAMLAVQETRDDLARQALQRSQEHLEQGHQLATTWESHKLETEKLKRSLRELTDKIEEAKRKKQLLVARQRRTEAQARISAAMSGLTDTSAFDTFARMEERIAATERTLLAAQEIADEVSGDRLIAEFRVLERSGRSVTADVRLQQLKERMGLLALPASDAKQLSAGAEHDMPASAALSAGSV